MRYFQFGGHRRDWTIWVGHKTGVLIAILTVASEFITNPMNELLLIYAMHK